MIGWILLALLGIFGFLGFAFFGELEAAMGIHLAVGVVAGAVGVVLARVLKQKLTGMLLFALVIAAGYSVYYGLAVFEGPWWDLLELTRFTAIFYALLVSGIVAAITGAMTWVTLRFMPKRFEFYTMVGLVGMAVVGLALMFVPYAMVPSEVYGQGFDQYAVKQVVGTSMDPTISENDWVLIRTSENPLFSVEVGDMVVFFPDKTALVNPEAMAYIRWGTPILHRVVHLYDDYVLTKGDNPELPSDFYFRRGEILGEAIKVFEQPGPIELWVLGKFGTELRT
ncbi:hypothetical protein ES703_34968 [subsurface metagenome]